MYKLEFLPLARQDMIDIVRYIGGELSNPAAAERLARKFIEEAERIPNQPYANPMFFPIKPLKHEYRKLLVQNFMMLYWVDEERKTVTVARVVYARRDYENTLE